MADLPPRRRLGGFVRRPSKGLLALVLAVCAAVASLARPVTSHAAEPATEHAGQANAQAGTAAPPGFRLPGAPPFGKGQAGLPGLEAQEPYGDWGDSRDRVKPSIKLSKTSVRPGEDLVVAVILDIQPGWHIVPMEGAPPPAAAPDLKVEEGMIYTAVKLPRPDGADAKAKGLQPKGLTVYEGFLQAPKVEAVDVKGTLTPCYEGYAIFYVPVIVAADAAPGPVDITLETTFQSCQDVCLGPATVPVTATVTVVPAGTATAATDLDGDFKGFDNQIITKVRSGEAPPDIVTFDLLGYSFKIDARGAGFVLLLLVAAVGGLLLNFTPCVLPVIPLKIMGLANTAGSRGRTIWLGLVMSAGVVAFWMALGVAVSTIKGFSSANQLFQYPAVTIAIGAIIVAMAVGMMGFFSVGLPQWVYMVNPKHESTHGSFLFGIMTAVLSTPCTAPLMGAAIAWAATRNVGTVLSVFAAVGVGMAIPYAVLASSPGLLSSMPRTGPASELIKQVMGLLLVAAGAFFLGSGFSGMMVTPPDPPSRLYWWVVALAGAVAGVWLLVQTIRITSSRGKRAFFGGIGLAIVAVSAFIGVTQTSKGPIKWVYYTAERLAEAKKRGDVVVIDFTAEWCLNCKLLEAGVLAPKPVSTLLNTPGVTPIKVDITGNNTAGNELLKSFDRITIPLLVVLKPDGTLVFKSDNYLQTHVLDALKEASGGKIVAQDDNGSIVPASTSPEATSGGAGDARRGET